MPISQGVPIRHLPHIAATAAALATFLTFAVSQLGIAQPHMALSLQANQSTSRLSLEAYIASAERDLNTSAGNAVQAIKLLPKPVAPAKISPLPERLAAKTETETETETEAPPQDAVKPTPKEAPASRVQVAQTQPSAVTTIASEELSAKPTGVKSPLALPIAKPARRALFADMKTPEPLARPKTAMGAALAMNTKTQTIAQPKNILPHPSLAPPKIALARAQDEAAAWVTHAADWQSETSQQSEKATAPMVSIIIDDMGHNKRAGRLALELPPQIAFAVLPNAFDADGFPGMARARGHELIVHMPMEPKGKRSDVPKETLKVGLSAAELDKRIVWNLSQFGGYFAVNNHMGSHFTEDAEAMEALFKFLGARNIAFIDSRTTAFSAARDLAHKYKVPYAERDVFLDNERSAASIGIQLRTLERLARRHGSAIAIGHPHSVTMAALQEWSAGLKDKGLALVPPSQVLKKRVAPQWRQIVRRDRQPPKTQLVRASFDPIAEEKTGARPGALQ